jgi:hypothetical protein
MDNPKEKNTSVGPKWLLRIHFQGQKIDSKGFICGKKQFKPITNKSLIWSDPNYPQSPNYPVSERHGNVDESSKQSWCDDRFLVPANMAVCVGPVV